MKNGQTDEAIKNYKISLKLDSKNVNAQKMINRMTKKKDQHKSLF